jgi:hypothetical protein
VIDSTQRGAARKSVMSRGTCLGLTFGLLLVAAHRLPAPISEIPSPTPMPEKSVRPRPKESPKAKSNPTHLNEAPSAQERKVTPQLKNQLATGPKTFQATWRGTLEFPSYGRVVFTLDVNASGTVVSEQSSNYNPGTFQAVADGRTVKWQRTNLGNWSLTPTPDGNTALVTSYRPSGFLGLMGWNLSSTFSKTSP